MSTARKAVRGPIAIDGPVAAGKSTIGRLVAERLGWASLDTGLMYRAVGYVAVERRLPMDDDDALESAAQDTDVRVLGREVAISVAGADLGAELTDLAVSAAASAVAARPRVRAVLVAKQQAIASETGGEIVMVGRDIGTVVLGDASTKIFLDGPAEERARRRHAEMAAGGSGVSYEEVLTELRARDARDMEREDSPLRPAADAHVVQSEGLGVEEVVEAVLRLAAGGGGGPE